MRGQTLFAKRAVVSLCLVLAMSLLFANVGCAQTSEIKAESHAPTKATAGETIDIPVTIRKSQGEAITGYLRSYIFARSDSVVGFSGSGTSSAYVAVNQEGYLIPGNQIVISMGENETEHTYVLANKIMDECPTVEAQIRIRLYNVNDNSSRRYNDNSLIFIEDASFGSVVVTKIAVAAAMSLMMISAVIVTRKQNKFIVK